MTEMVERVARALYDNACLAVPSISVDFDGAHPEKQDAMRHQARAAIEAMREVTEDMRVAGANWTEYKDGDNQEWDDIDKVVSTRVFKAMIDAALK